MKIFKEKFPSKGGAASLLPEDISLVSMTEIKVFMY